MSDTPVTFENDQHAWDIFSAEGQLGAHAAAYMFGIREDAAPLGPEVRKEYPHITKAYRYTLGPDVARSALLAVGDSSTKESWLYGYDDPDPMRADPIFFAQFPNHGIGFMAMLTFMLRRGEMVSPGFGKP